MNIAVLFDGAGLARLGLEQAGHTCTGFEIDPLKHHLSLMVGSGRCVLADVRDVDLTPFDAVWASPPCQKRSQANIFQLDDERYPLHDDLLEFSLGIQERYPHLRAVWVENVPAKSRALNAWGKRYNAAQFLEDPLQNRVRVIGGKFQEPRIYRVCKLHYHYDGLHICPTITASEAKGGVGDFRRASKYYGRRISLEEAAYHQGFEIPRGLLKSWYHIPHFQHPRANRYFTWREWRDILYEAIGNGVPVYMARAFGEVYEY